MTEFSFLDEQSKRAIWIGEDQLNFPYYFMSNFQKDRRLQAHTHRLVYFQQRSYCLQVSFFALLINNKGENTQSLDQK